MPLPLPPGDDLCQHAASMLRYPHVSPEYKPVRAGDFGLLMAAWFLYAVISRPTEYIHHDTSEIMMWSQVGWPLGFFKHPPLLPWLFRVVFSVLPIREETVALLSAANITVGAWAVWRIARLATNERSAFLALVLYLLSPFVTFLSLKMNHNSILISLWPLTTLFFLRSLRDRTALSGILFGTFAALSILAKYYSFLLLAGCLAASWISLRRGAFYRSPAPYLSVAVFAGLLSPHLYWVVTSGMGPLGHAFQTAGDPVWRAVRFGIGGPLILLPVFIGYGAATALARRSTLAGPRQRSPFDRELVTITAVPFALTLIMTIALTLRTSTNWAIPIFSLVPVILAAHLPLFPLPDLARIKAIARISAVGLVVVSPVAYVLSFLLGGAGFVEPRGEVGVYVGAVWQQAFDRPLKVVSGDRELATAATFELASHPTEWTDFSFDLAPWLTSRDVERNGLAVICRADDPSCRRKGREVLGSASGFSCLITQTRIVGPMVGPTLSVEAFLVAPADASRANPVCGVPGSTAVARLNQVVPRPAERMDGWITSLDR